MISSVSINNFRFNYILRSACLHLVFLTPVFGQSFYMLLLTLNQQAHNQNKQPCVEKQLVGSRSLVSLENIKKSSQCFLFFSSLYKNTFDFSNSHVQ